MKSGTERIGNPLSSATLMLVLWCGVIVVQSCSSDRMTDPEAPPVIVTVSPTSATVPVGGSTRLTAAVQNASSSAVIWQSADPTVAFVDADGNVTGVRAGSTLVSATALSGNGASASATIIVTAPPSSTVDIVITNSLYNAVNITVNGIAVGSIPARSTRQAQVQRTGSITMSWSLVRTTTTSGVPVGDDISGHFEPITNPGQRIDYTIDAVVGQTFIFRPIIVNQTGATLLMGVNEGLQSQNRCNCTVPPASTGTVIGYYYLYSNSNVRAYRNGSGYTGSYIYWTDFANGVDRVSGDLRLIVNTPPAPGIATARSGSIDVDALREPATSPSDGLGQSGPALPDTGPASGLRPPATEGVGAAMHRIPDSSR